MFGNLFGGEKRVGYDEGIVAISPVYWCVNRIDLRSCHCFMSLLHHLDSSHALQVRQKLSSN